MLVVFLLLLLLFIWLVKNNFHPIPGPFCLPFCGSAPIMMLYDTGMLSHPHRVMHRLARIYGPVMRVMLGDQEWIVLSGLEEVKEFTSKEESTYHFSSDTMNDLYSFGKPLGVISPDGALWKEQRKFVSQSLRKLAGSMGEGLETRVLEEVEQVNLHLDRLMEDHGECIVRMDDFFDLPCLNVMWGLVNNQRFSYTDSHLRRMIQLIDSFTMNPMIGLLVGIPYLKWLPPFSWMYRRILASMAEFKQRMRGLVEEGRASYSEGEVRGYIDLFLGAGQGREHYTEEQLVVTLIDFFTGGSGTMSKSLSFAVLYSLSCPEVLARVQEELSALQGEVRLSDHPRLPYTLAVLQEAARMGCVLPIAPPRKTSGPLQVGKHLLPAGSLVQVSLYNLHRDPHHWGDPETFRPERFLQDGKLIQDDWLLPFSVGRRRCLGESLARDTVFLIFCRLLQRYSLEPLQASSLPTGQSVGGLTIGPGAFSARLAKRRDN